MITTNVTVSITATPCTITAITVGENVEVTTLASVAPPESAVTTIDATPHMMANQKCGRFLPAMQVENTGQW
jgi:hypothetical protein